MKMRKTALILLVCLLLSLSATAQNQRGPSTPEERQRFVTLVHKLEKAPLDETLRPEVKWALQWLDAVPDVTVNVCPGPLADLVGSHYQHAPQIFGLYVLAMGAFAIEHPGKAHDNAAQYLGGVESALKGYQVILKDKPDARSKILDDLTLKQKEGKLADFVRKSSKDCQSGGQ